MKLFFRELGGSGKPLLILHGLFGSSKNWITNGKALSAMRKVYALDLRNHGDSPHSDSHSLLDMANDLKEFVVSLDQKPDIMGHSMGGMTASLFALQNPELLDGLIVIDISPRSYPVQFGKEFEALELDVSHSKSREEVDRMMSTLIPDIFLRQFLQMNLEKTESGYRWKINVRALKAGRAQSLEFPRGLSPIDNPSLFVLGENSEYIQESDTSTIQNLFQKAEIKTIPGAGHYLHYFQAEEFLKISRKFLENL